MEKILKIDNKESDKIESLEDLKKINKKYDTDGLVDFDKSLINIECPICLLVCVNTKMCSCCNAIFCKDCIKEIWRKCPLCNDPNFSCISTANTPVDYQLKKLKAKCVNHVNGCLTVSNIISIENHQLNCLYKQVKCKQSGCFDKIIQIKMIDHYMNSCHGLQIECYMCNINYNLIEYINHLEKCSKNFTKCKHCLFFHKLPKENVASQYQYMKFNINESYNSNQSKTHQNCSMIINSCDLCGLPDFKVDFEKNYHKCLQFKESFINTKNKDINISYISNINHINKEEDFSQRCICRIRKLSV